MVELKSTERLDRREKSILVGVLLPDSDVSSDDPLDEIRGLAKSAGLAVVGSLLQKRQQVDVATYIGSGKVEELKALVQAHEADLVVFDKRPRPRPDAEPRKGPGRQGDRPDRGHPRHLRHRPGISRAFGLRARGNGLFI